MAKGTRRRRPQVRVLMQTDDLRVEVPLRAEKGTQRKLPFIGDDEAEVEKAQCGENEAGKQVCQLFRFTPERLKRVKDPESGKQYLVPKAWTPEWPHPLHEYEEWFVKHLDQVASYVDSSRRELENALTSEDPVERARVYEDIGSHLGFNNLDSYPTEMTEKQLERRWKSGRRTR